MPRRLDGGLSAHPDSITAVEGHQLLPTDRVKKRDSVAGQALSDDYVLLDLTSGVCFAMGVVGGYIWELLDDGQILRDVATAVSDSYAITYEQAEEDVLDFVDSLVQRGLAHRE